MNRSNEDNFLLQQKLTISIEETLLDSVLQGSNEGIAIISSHGTILKHNQKLLELLEYSNENLVGLPLSTIIPKLTSLDFDMINYDSRRSSTKLIIRKNTYSTALIDHTILYISEIDPPQTELVRQLEEANVLKETYEKIINSIDEGIHSIDTNGNFLLYNPAEEKLEGYKASDILGKHVTEIYNLDKTTSLLLKVLETGIPIYNKRQEYFTKHGKHIDVITSTMPLHCGNNIVGSIAISKDFTQFRHMAERILDLQEKLTTKYSKTRSSPQNEKCITFDSLLGLNTLFEKSVSWAKAASKTDSPILLFGETGTGKELFAQSIHAESKRSHGPFLAINCAAIPENLLEGILFGTVKGAFTGAINRGGLFEQANGGTLFLDEINSMPLALQSKILRVLEEKKVRRVGGNEEILINPRIISSCNVLPTTAIERGQIRADLFYRLAVVYLFIPPLRDRIDDLVLLSNYFIQELNRPLEKNITGLHPEVISAFKRYAWPGNIRQLKHTIECAMNIIPTDEIIISPCHIPSYLGIFSHENIEVELEKEDKISPPCTILNKIKDQEKDIIISALRKSKGNVAKAAEDLGLSRQLLQYRLKKLGLK